MALWLFVELSSSSTQRSAPITPLSQQPLLHFVCTFYWLAQLAVP
jgi:hypothetical protein